MRSLSGRRRLTAVAAAGVLLAGGLTACTDEPPSPKALPRTPPTKTPTTTEPTTPPPEHFVTTDGDDPLQMLAADTAEAAALSTSQALFTEAPAVVVATPTDAAAVASATKTAAELGLPVLASTTALSDLEDELERLETTTVLTVDPAAASFVADALSLPAAGTETGTGSPTETETPTESQTKPNPDPTDGRVTTVDDPVDLPALIRAEPRPGTAVLTTGATTDALALATAAAAGATVVMVPTGDPRASADAVTALGAAKPSRTLALGETFGAEEGLARRLASAATGVQLPGGGQLVLADRRYVAMYGHPGTPSLGILGEQPLTESIARAHKLRRTYDAVSDLPIVPTFEIITTVASGGAGKDDNYSNEIDPAVLLPWVRAAREQGVYVLLDLQPGTTDFLTQAKRYESLLAYPNVGLALDPEWRLAAGQKHMAQIGSVTAAEVNATSAWLAEFTRSKALPQKMLVLHQFSTKMITERETLNTSYDELAVVIHADGHGTPGAKSATWNRIRQNAPAGVFFAWKNFVDEDRPTFTPAQTMAIRPVPVLVSYQ